MEPQLIKDYTERFLGALERIAQALESAHPLIAAAPRRRRAPETPLGELPVSTLSVSATAAASSIPYPVLKQAILGYQDRHGYQAGVDLVKRHGATYMKDLKPEQYPALMAEISTKR
jgi:hypothetical protein